VEETAAMGTKLVQPRIDRVVLSLAWWDHRSVATSAGDRVRFEPRPDPHGYWTTVDGRWKAKDHKPSGGSRSVTLTDTTRRTIFADTARPGRGYPLGMRSAT
jgi:hypothetical protein